MTHAADPQSAARHTNRLSKETSPYLLQHAHNPVDWRPWGAAALAAAREQDKPIFLSVGYSTCHWCHVMAHESFEDEGVAAVMNDRFICVKVDREELPDVDEQYMLATQLSTGRGGWPNSVVLTPDGRPWFAGTYFPKARFVPLLEELGRVWKEQRPDVEQQADKFAQTIRQASASRDTDRHIALDMSLVEKACDYFRSAYDSHHGGIGTAPKFPPHGALALWLDEQRRTGDLSAMAALTHTLDAMAMGGIYDHVGGGFHRYSTDARWFLPHFEKMLYDNAQLLRAYSSAYRLTGHGGYKRIVSETFDWLQREMTDPAGGFYSALDADSEGEEGKFYVWTMREIRNVLGGGADPFIETYNITERGTYHEEATGHTTGANIPFLAKPQAASFERERRKLLEARNKRVRPHLDDKVLASWNGLMIGALAEAGRLTDEPRYTQAAVSAAEFVLTRMRTPDGKLLRTWRKGEAKIPGYLDDYAFFIEGLVELHVTTGHEGWLREARSLADVMVAEFYDTRDGGFFFTSKDHDALLLRGKELGGGGNQPAGNGVAADVLLRLAVMTGVAGSPRREGRYADCAAATLRHFAPTLHANPHGSESLALALSRYLQAADTHPQLKLAERLAPPKEAADADAVAGQPPVTVRAFVSQPVAAPGSTLRVAVQIEIADGCHIYAHNVDPTTRLTPTTLQCVGAGSLKAGTIAWPQAKATRDPVLNTQLLTYEGRVTVVIPIIVAKETAEGPTQLRIRFRAQACDDKACYPPVDYELSVAIQVKIDATPGPLRHPDVFGSD